MNAIHLAALAIYALSSLLLFAFGVNLTRASFIAWRHRRSGRVAEGPAMVAAGDLPRVTVQLPIYNEPMVARRIIDAAARLDYPRHRLQIQVLDDSTDGTSAIAAAAVEDARRSGLDIEHLRRSARTGYKAGALAAGLGRATGELVAIFDADFVPPTDFLRRAVGPFVDRTVGFVQGRWGHLNPDETWLTRLQVPAIDGHFLVEQRARGLAGHWFNFNGTAGVWRVAAIDDAGGWQHDTLTEDLDLSYRASLRGWRGVYLEDLVVPGEVPATMSGFRRQQRRWARGSLECAMKLLGPVWRSQASPGVKVQATTHLLAYTVHLLLVALVLAYPFVLAATSALPVTRQLFGFGYLFAPASIAPALFLAIGQALQPGMLRRRFPAVLAMIVFGSGLMVNTLRAALDIAVRPNPEFERTPKSGAAGDTGNTAAAVSEQGSAGGCTVVAEVALGLYGLGTAVLAIGQRSWGIAVYACLFAVGLLGVALATVVERRVGSVRRSASPAAGGRPSRQPIERHPRSHVDATRG